MKKTLLKETGRNIRKNLMSWIAIAVVTMIGCGVYCGVFFYADAMERDAQEYFIQTNYEDFVHVLNMIIEILELECEDL